MTNRINMFATANDTAKWAVAVDGLFGLFATRDEAERVYATIRPKGVHFDDTPFCSCEMIPPGYIPRDCRDQSDTTKSRLSECQPIDIAGYIAKAAARQLARYQRTRPVVTTAQRLQEHRQHNAFWGQFAQA